MVPVVPNKPGHPGSWSQSKRWVSSEAKERLAFQRMAANLHYMGADKSPFVPQTARELTKFRAEVTEAQKQRLIAEVARRERSYGNRGRSNRDGGGAAKVLKGLLHGKRFSDRLSVVFAVDNCFNKDMPLDGALRVDWPTLAELKEEGDKRASRYGRYFPLPRLNTVAQRILELEGDDAYNDDGSIRWDKKAVKLGSCNVMPVSPMNEPPFQRSPSQVAAQELPFVVRELLKAIDKDAGYF